MADKTNNQNSAVEFLLGQRNFFKLSTLIILMLLLLAQYAATIFKVSIIPESISLMVACICVIYMWLAERKDVAVLQETNIKLFRAQENLKNSHVETILSLVLSQEAKDSYTYGHSERVKQYAMMLAKELNLTEKETELIARAAKLHDIGKIGIKDEILFSHNKLTPAQYQEIKSHPLKGVAILEPLKFLQREKVIVKHHHERFDGTGYPDGLKGEAIPLGARIICVADAFDAMRTSRPYAKALSKEEVIRELAFNAGAQFDPKISETLIRSIDRFYR
ncbi:MAG TPA: HD-GYP domain-containing protein [Candidatus Omnitrophota bacterium]|nr:HD-GYP domain-containing protein [Candidatus Omnitrophota bacterium]HPD84429.1 HD-GYP domain-containing protein [Candidatus Omnitrophota bacterium]HRZ03287.1 HD-GYP domain-containing protein [Candidatus Omnitrophota bacterium]